MYKIMIIEDDLVMAEAIAKEMNAWGNEAVYVKNFQNVLSFFAAQAPHLDTTGAARYGKCRMYR